MDRRGGNKRLDCRQMEEESTVRGSDAVYRQRGWEDDGRGVGLTAKGKMNMKGTGGMKATLVAAAIGFGMVVGSLVGGAGVDAAPQGKAGAGLTRNFACDCETKVTTSNLNLRSGPGTNYDVLLVMQKGVKLQAELNPDYHQNGFVKVSYGNNYGWASEQYLADPGTGGESTGGDAT